jgi:hypothetical protein
METRMGRPPKSPDESLPERLYVRVSTDEKETMEAVAEKAGLKLSVWIRDRLMKAAKRESK